MERDETEMEMKKSDTTQTRDEFRIEQWHDGGWYPTAIVYTSYEDASETIARYKRDYPSRKYRLSFRKVGDWTACHAA